MVHRKQSGHGADPKQCLGQQFSETADHLWAPSHTLGCSCKTPTFSISRHHFLSAEDGSLLQVFPSQEPLQKIIEAHLAMQWNTSSSSSHPTEPAATPVQCLRDNKCPLYQMASRMSPACHKGWHHPSGFLVCRRDQPSAAAPHCPHSIHLQSNGAVPSPPLPLTLLGPCHNLPSSSRWPALLSSRIHCLVSL